MTPAATVGVVEMDMVVREVVAMGVGPAGEIDARAAGIGTVVVKGAGVVGATGDAATFSVETVSVSFPNRRPASRRPSLPRWRPSIFS